MAIEIGQKYGRLTVLSRTERKTKKSNYYYSCRCDCGQEKEILGSNISSGSIVSCGCYKDQTNTIKNMTRQERIDKGEHSKYLPKGISFTEFCKSHGLSPQTVYSRIKRGWNIKRALATPPEESTVKRTRRNRVKGKKLEDAVVKLLQKHFDWDEDDVRRVGAGCSGVDVIMSKKAREQFPVSIECKNTVDFPKPKAFKQAKKNRIEGTIAAVVWHEHGSNYDDSIIMFDLEEFLDWYKEQTQ